jgi:hypothetical protein
MENRMGKSCLMLSFCSPRPLWAAHEMRGCDIAPQGGRTTIITDFDLFKVESLQKKAKIF